MIVNVKFFALTRELVGKSKSRQKLENGSTLDDFTQLLFAEFPALKSLGLRFAVNMTYAPMDTVLFDADEIACIPPVGGG